MKVFLQGYSISGKSPLVRRKKRMNNETKYLTAFTGTIFSDKIFFNESFEENLAFYHHDSQPIQEVRNSASLRSIIP
jgi:hypothetical protein